MREPFTIPSYEGDLCQAPEGLSGLLHRYLRVGPEYGPGAGQKNSPVVHSKALPRGDQDLLAGSAQSNTDGRGLVSVLVSFLPVQRCSREVAVSVKHLVAAVCGHP